MITPMMPYFTDETREKVERLKGMGIAGISAHDGWGEAGGGCLTWAYGEYEVQEVNALSPRW